VPAQRLSQLLFSQGFGSRRECQARIISGQVAIGGITCTDPDAIVPTDGLVLEVDGHPWPYHQHALILLHKPAGYECSTRPRHHPGVLSLLPAPLRQRGVQPIGRLDEDTTGVLLLTDDGKLIHRLTSPKHHVPKVYEVITKHPVQDLLLHQLLQGVVLDDDPAPVRASAARITGSHGLQLTLTQGRYHQVKRMVAAAGNRVVGLHRSAFGAVQIPPSLEPGQWMWLPAGAAG